MDCSQLIEGVVKDKGTLAVLPGSVVTLFNSQGTQVAQTTVGADAAFKFEGLPCNEEYLARAQKPSYISDEKKVATGAKGQRREPTVLLLEIDEKELTPGKDLAKILDIPIIYFDLDKSNIRPDAEIELRKVITLLKQFPTIKIDVRSHTDSRAPYLYNEALSGRRNKATIRYIVRTGGIAANRITGKGYGEHNLVNNCSDGVNCTEAEHQFNRRSEFIILEK
ncbi:peptidoglycan-associated lipoprotein [Flavobacterium chryseum]|uniref:OmpA family protein n=1 Tax=Flavobacterium sp. P3160 TaxID=2512113 RepID=UPI00105B26EC|nr:OmpA family protein [Flavobacterium sp. P3160]TDO70382.1 peptidoglycan-associated lipoprotein [Flavobacterium sp. P3160]